jgi:rubrerythrin
MAETMQEEEQQQEERIERKPKRNDRWVCPKCGTGITLLVKSTYAPTCNSDKHSTTGPVLMELKSKK